MLRSGMDLTHETPSGYSLGSPLLIALSTVSLLVACGGTTQHSTDDLPAGASIVVEALPVTEAPAESAGRAEEVIQPPAEEPAGPPEQRERSGAERNDAATMDGTAQTSSRANAEASTEAGSPAELTPPLPERATRSDLPSATEEDANAHGSSAAEPSEQPGGACVLPPEDPDVQPQLRQFARWLRDQTVGRHVTIDHVRPRCGELDGRVIIAVRLEGPAGGLQSLGRALPLYWPGATWSVEHFERLPAEEARLRIDVEVRLQRGSTMRPRCEWDPDTPCPGRR